MIGEARCMAESGHEFRPDYLDLGGIKQTYQNVQISCFTVTAPKDTCTFILNHLKLNDCVVFKQPIRRSNLAFSVKTKSKKKQVNDEIISLVSGRLSGQCGIIYCSKANDVVDLAYQVSNCKAQIPVSMYFTAPIVTRDRVEELHNWLTGKTLVLIATKSAGVGIDKNDVRFVIDADMPNSIEEFFQEGGRAGRDGSSSEVILYYRHEDKAAHVKHIGEIENSVVRESSMNKLHSILRYANTNKMSCSVHRGVFW